MPRPLVHLLLAFMLICAGCGDIWPLIELVCETCRPQPAKPDSMIALVQLPIHRSPSTVAVSVVGGSETPQWGTVPSQISDEDFASALRQSIEQSKLFAQANKEVPANYQLQAFIKELTHQGFLTATLNVTYTLLRNGPKEIVWRKAMTSTYTVPRTAIPAFTGSAKVSRLATEGAARSSIEQAILEMSQLQLE